MEKSSWNNESPLKQPTDSNESPRRPFLKEPPSSRRLSVESNASSCNDKTKIPPDHGAYVRQPSLRQPLGLNSRQGAIESNPSAVISDNLAVDDTNDKNSSNEKMNKMMDSKGEDEGGRSALTEADYWEFVNRKTSSRNNESTYSERKRRESSECDWDEHNMDEPSIAIGSQESISSHTSNAQRLKTRAIQEVNTDTDNNKLGDGGSSAAERLKYGGAPGGVPLGVSDEDVQILNAEVQVSIIEWESSVGETYEDLTEEEARMIAAVQSSWRSGEEYRREMNLMSMNCLSEDEDDQSWGAEGGASTRQPSFRRSESIQATLVEEMPPLPPPVEAIPVEEEEVERNKVLKRYNILVFILIMVVIASIVGSSQESFWERESSSGAEAGPNSPSAELYEPTLLRIQKEGVLRCGVAEHKYGLSSYNDVSGNLEGMAIDLCTAVAIFAIGTEYKVELVKVTGSTRFTSLLDIDIDLLVYGDTHTMERDFHEKATGAGFQFSDPYIYDGLRFAGLPKAVECADNHDWFGECRDLSICVMAASTHEEILRPLLPRQKLRPMVTHDEYLQAFMNGTCLVMAGEQNQIAQVRVQARGYEGEYSYGQTQLSKEPLAMVTRKGNHGDQIWSDTCNLVLKALIYAEEHNVTQHDARLKLPAVPFVSVVETVGNYAEMYSRRMEQVFPRSGMNLLYDTRNMNSSGLHYSHPFGSIDKPYHEFNPSGKIHKIIERGKLICGVLGDRDQSMDTDYCRSLAASLFDSDTTLVEFIQLSDDDSLVERVNSGEIDVIAGATRSLGENVLKVMASSNQTEFNASRFSFSKPYFYGENVACQLATSTLDADWSSFVYWVVEVSVWAEENSITSNDFQLVPEVESFGSRFEWMFKGSTLGRGNYAEIYDRNNDTLPARSRHNLLNDGSSPQLYP